MTFVDEKSYRLKIRETYELIEARFEGVDPDQIEVEQGQGTLSLASPNGKIILSTQPSVQQLWLAVATQGKAVHFNYDPELDKWMDDKDKGLELFQYLSQVIETSTGVKVKF